MTKAAVETVAENFGDGVLRRYFIWRWAIRCACTFTKPSIRWIPCLDIKMNGFCIFGRCAAKLDDIANFIPARLAGLTLVLSAYLGPLTEKNAARIFFGIAVSMPVRIQPIPRLRRQVRWIYSWQAMLTTSGSFMKSHLSVIRCRRSDRMTSGA